MEILIDYLEENFEQDIVEHVLRVYVNRDGKTCFYIHPANVNGETLDFMVEEKSVESIVRTIDAEIVP